MIRIHPKPALTALALILAASGPGWTQEAIVIEDPTQQPGDGFDLAGDQEPDIGAATAPASGAAPDAAATPDAALAPVIVADPAPPPAELSGEAVNVASPDTPPAADTAVALPEGWVWRERFGLRFGVPAGFAWQEDMEESDEREGTMAAIGQIDPATHVGSLLMLMFTTPQSLRLEGEALPSAMAEKLSGDFGFEISATSETRELLGQTFDVLVGHAEPMPGIEAHAFVLVGRAAVNDWGFLPIIGLVHSAIPAADAEALNDGVLATMSLTGTAPLGAPDPRRLAGLIEYQVPPGAEWRDDSGGRGGRARFNNGPGTPDFAQLGLSILDLDPMSYRNDTERLLPEAPTQSDALLDGVMAMSFEGRPGRSLMPGQPAPEGDGWIQRLVVTRMCAPGFGPIVVNAITTEERIAAGFGLDWLIAPVDLTLPDDAAPCPDDVMAPFLGLMPEGMAPPSGLEPPPAEDLPMPGDAEPDLPAVLDMPDAAPDAVPGNDGPVAHVPPPDVSDPGIKPPLPSADPEASAWAEAERAQSAAAMLAYVANWPQGAHAAEARAWLAARAIAVPDAGPAQPPMPPTMQPPIPAQQPGIPQPDELSAWLEAQRLGTATALWDFLKAWPNGQFAQQAWIALDLRRGGPIQPAPAPIPAPMPAPPGK